ncbi:MAG: hypothetical protein GC149_20540 [Gammaproteobacteria bacterium]|nr:hypothetical protein [Gammaproteobacteria bacterium]
MTIRVTWPKSQDEQFRARYLAVTGEIIQGEPAENADGTFYSVGSARIQQGHIDTLSAEFPDVVFGADMPEWWEPKQENDGPGE